MCIVSYRHADGKAMNPYLRRRSHQQDPKRVVGLLGIHLGMEDRYMGHRTELLD
jgi:hypothetical protein